MVAVPVATKEKGTTPEYSCSECSWPHILTQLVNDTDAVDLTSWCKRHEALLILVADVTRYVRLLKVLCNEESVEVPKQYHLTMIIGA